MVPRWWWQLLAPSRGEVWGKMEGKALPWGDVDAHSHLGTQPAALQVPVVSQKDATRRHQQTNKQPPVYRCYPGIVFITLNKLKTINRKKEQRQRNPSDGF